MELVSMVDGIPKTTSLIVAKNFDKQHKDVLRRIENLECSQYFTQRNFTLSEYTDPTGRKLPMYEMTRDGWTFLCMGFNGKKAAEWKEKYISAFNAMEQKLIIPASPVKLPIKHPHYRRRGTTGLLPEKRWPCVYFLFQIIGQRIHTKIGVSRNPMIRVQMMQNYNSVPFAGLYIVRLPSISLVFRCEVALHKLFDQYRLHGEWFDLTSFEDNFEKVFGIVFTPAYENWDITQIKIKPSINNRKRLAFF